jgi:hypothetical protein
MKLMIVRPKELPGSTERPVRNAEYVFQPKTMGLIDPTTKQPSTLGQKRIVAVFQGTPPQFDSEISQKANGWTDDERLAVERHLLTHRDYGRGIYLFPGETIPAEHEGIVEEVGSPVPAVSGVAGERGFCKFVIAEFPLEVCGATSLPGGDLCDQHFRETEIAAQAAEKPKRPQKQKAEVA